MSKIKTVLQFEKPTPSAWRTDIENAPRDVTDILIMDSYGYRYFVHPDNDDDYTWKTDGPDCDIFKNSEIPYWMEITELLKS